MKKSDSITFAAVLGLIFVSLAYISTMYLRACPAILVPDLQQSFGADAAQVALFSSAALLGYGIMQMPSGLITDAIGGRKTLVLFTTVAAIATLAFAFSPSLSLGVSARFIAGLCMAAVPPMVAIIAYSLPIQLHTRALGICMAAGGLGFLLASEPLARLATALGWRTAMAISAVVMLITAACIFVTLKEEEVKPANAPKNKISLKAIGQNMLRVFKTKEYWPLALTQLFATAAAFSFMSMWVGPYLINAYGMNQVEASRILFIQGLTPVFIIPVITTIADKINSRKTMLVICLIGGCCGGFLMAIFAGQLSFYALTASVMLFNACCGGAGTLVFALIARNFPKDITGTGTGCVNMFWPIVASVLNVLLGLVVKAKMGALEQREDIIALALDNPVAAQISASAEAYGLVMYILTGMWVVALLISVFFIKENFTVKGS